MLNLLIALQAAVVTAAHRSRRRPPAAPGRRLRGCGGQTTAEYALVMLAAAAIAGLILTWASKSDLVGKLFGFALSKILGAVA